MHFLLLSTFLSRVGLHGTSFRINQRPPLPRPFHAIDPALGRMMDTPILWDRFNCCDAAQVRLGRRFSLTKFYFSFML